MTELFTTQPVGLAAILMALAFLVNVLARGLAPVLAACARAIDAWTQRTNDERDCAPKLAAAIARIEKLERLAKSAVDGEQQAIKDAAAGAATIAERINVIERGDEPTGNQHVPAGLPPRRKR